MREEAVCTPCTNIPQYKEKRGGRGDVNILSQDIRFRAKTYPVSVVCPKIG